MAVVRGELTVEVGAEDADVGELAEMTSQLRAWLLDLDVDVARPSEESLIVPEHAKGDPPQRLDSLIVQLLLQQQVLQSVIGALQSWLGRRPGRSIKMTIDGDSLELTGVSTAQLDQLVEVWVKRHAREG